MKRRHRTGITRPSIYRLTASALGLVLALDPHAAAVNGENTPPLSANAPAAFQSGQSGHFEGRIDQARASFLLARLEELATREKQLLEKSDYEGLIVLETQRTAVIAELTTSLLSADKMAAAGAIVLNPDQARLSGEVTRGDSVSAKGLSNWGEESSSSWQVEEIEPGYFAVQILCSPPEESRQPDEKVQRFSPQSENGEDDSPADIIVFGESTHFVSDQERLLTRAIEPISPGTGMRSIHLGVLALTEAAADIQLRVKETRGGGIMNLEAVFLIRTAKPAPDPKLAGESSSPGFDLMIEEHRKAILALREPIDQAYLDELKLLHARLEEEGRSSQAKAVIDESNRVQGARSELLIPGTAKAKAGVKEARGPQKTEDAGPGGARETVPTGRPDSALSVLRGCRLVGEPAAGDQFVARHKKREFPVQLFYVECPELRPPSDSGFADYFKIDPAQIPAVAEMARAFTWGLLRETNFSLWTTGEKTPDGHLLAIVQIPALGSLQQLLVSEGLGIIRTDRKPSASRKHQLFIDLILPEKEAEARRSRAGAWQF